MFKLPNGAGRKGRYGMKFTEMEHCPRCHSPSVYTLHETGKELYDIHCIYCNLSTAKYNSYKMAEREWDKIVKQYESEKS